MANYKRFKEHNLRKVRSLKECLTTQKWRAFCAVPWLIHYDFPGLPCSSGGQVPSGFRRSAFLDGIHEGAKEILTGLRTDAPPPRQPVFLGLYAMGSVGSSCFTSASDIDYWLIYPAGALDTMERRAMEGKLHEIERWAMEKGNLEITIFLHDLGEIQTAGFGDDSENAGEFGAILKEEFLRTATYVAGQEPVHWGETDAPAIEFGTIPHLETRQYLAACLMLLEKALEKPFKAALKIALLRRLAARPGDKLPAELYTDAVEAGEDPDQYMLLLKYLWEHFNAVGAQEDHAFLKNSLYLKMVSEETSPERLKKNTERMVKARFQSIGRPVDFQSLDGFFTWPFERRIQYSEQIAQYLQASLKEISEFPDAKFLDPSRFRALTRKIQLRRQSGRVIESLTFADVPSRGEKELSFLFSEKTGEWHLTLERIAGHTDPSTIRVVKSAPSPIPLLAFALKNNLFASQRTEIRAFPSDQFPSKTQDLNDRIRVLLSSSSTFGGLPDDENAPERHLVVLEQPNSNRIDTRRVTVLTKTALGVVEYRVFSGESSLGDAVQVILRSLKPPGGVDFISDKPVGPEPPEFADAVMRSFVENPAAAVILKEQSRYMILKNRTVKAADSVPGLLHALGHMGGRFIFTRLPDDSVRRLVEDIFAPPPRPVVRLFKIKASTRVVFLLLDSKGFCHSWLDTEENAKFGLVMTVEYLRALETGVGVECFNIEYKKGLKNPWEFSPFVPERQRSPDPSSLLHFELIDSRTAHLICGGRRMENQALPAAIQIAARFIESNRRGAGSYPAHISSLILPPELSSRLSAADVLRMKQEMETRIDRLVG